MKRHCNLNVKENKKNIRLSSLALLIITYFSIFRSALADTHDNYFIFNRDFLRSDVNIDEFSQGNPVPSGIHSVELNVNSIWKGRADVTFKKKSKDERVAQPCFNLRIIELMGINKEKIKPDALSELRDENSCVFIEKLSTNLVAYYDVSSLKLNVQAPQAYLLRHSRGYVSPELWDNGISAALLQYDYNAYQVNMSGSAPLSIQYLGLRGGINWDVWRLRYRSSSNWSDGKSWRYGSTNTYLERAIKPLRSKLIIGESATESQVFKNVGFRGVVLNSDDRMYEDSQRGYAPVITGIASTNALVRISQRGMIIYETTVPPGAFEIDDLYPSASGDDLLVTVKEADGHEHSFTVTYASTAELLRPDTTRYTLMGGRYHNTSINEKPEIFMGTVRHGINNMITAYTGGLTSKYYESLAGGIAFNTPAGAFSTGITHARTTLRDHIEREGKSLHISFAENLSLTNTHVMLSSYHYSKKGYYDMDDAMRLRSDNTYHASGESSISRKNRLYLSASQKINSTPSSITFSASTQDYWNHHGRETEYQAGFSHVFPLLNISINASKTYERINRRRDNKLAIGLSFPLGNNAQSVYLNSTYIIQEGKRYGMQNSLAGSAGVNREYNYNAFTNADHYATGITRTTGGVSGNMTSPYTSLGGSYSAGYGYQQYGVTLSGGAVAYRNGIVLTPIMGDTMAVIEAGNARGARVASNSSLRLDKNGKAAVPYLTPYRKNTIELDPKGLSNDVSMDITSHDSVPTAGAVVLLKYKTDTGHSILFNVRHPGGELPFGAPLLDLDNNIVGYVAQGGQSFVRVKKEQGILRVQWGEKATRQCQFSYYLPVTPSVPNTNLLQRDVVCQ